MKKIKVVMLIVLMISIVLTTQVQALSELDGASGKLIASFISQQYKYVDTYLVDNKPYECYFNTDLNRRLYYKKDTDRFVVDGTTLKKLETVYAVNMKNTDPVFIDYKMKQIMQDVEKSTKNILNDIKKYLLCSEIVKTTSGIGGDILGVYATKGKSVVTKEVESLFIKVAKNEVSNKIIEKKSATDLINNLVTMGVVNGYLACIDSYKRGIEKYSTYSDEKIKDYTYAKEIMDDFDYSATTFKAIWGYTENVIIPQLPKDLADSARKVFGEWVFPSLIKGFFGAYENTEKVALVGDVFTSYTNYNDLVNFYKKYDITSDDITAIGDIVDNTYREKLTDRQKSLLQVVGKYCPEFLEMYYSINQNRGYVTEDFAATGFRTVNELFGELDMYSASSPYKLDIDDLKNYGILDRSTLYLYKTKLNREDFCGILYKVYRQLEGNKANISYKDWFIDTNNMNVLALRSLGIINGKNGLLFEPTKLITRAEVAIAIGKTLEKTGLLKKGNVNIKDCSKIDSVTLGYIKNVLNTGIMKLENGNFYPNNNISLEELLVLCNRIINISPSHIYTLDPQLKKYIPSSVKDFQFTYLNLKDDTTKEALILLNEGSSSKILVFEMSNNKWNLFGTYTNSERSNPNLDSLDYNNSIYLGNLKINGLDAPAFLLHGSGYSYNAQAVMVLSYDKNKNNFNYYGNIIGGLLNIYKDNKLPQSVLKESKKVKIDSKSNSIIIDEGENTEYLTWNSKDIVSKNVPKNITKPSKVETDLVLTVKDGLTDDEYYGDNPKKTKVKIGQTIYFKDAGQIVYYSEAGNLYEWIDKTHLKVLKKGTFEIWLKSYGRNFIFVVE